MIKKITIEFDIEADSVCIRTAPADIANKKTEYIYEDMEGKIGLIINNDNILMEIKIYKMSRCLPKNILKFISSNINSAYINYDMKSDSAYIYILPVKHGQVADTYPFNPYEIGAEIFLDFDKAGKFLAVEMLYASKHLPNQMLR